MITDLANIVLAYVKDLQFMAYETELESCYRAYSGLLDDEYDYILTTSKQLLYKMNVVPSAKYSMVMQDFHDTHVR